LRGYAAAQEQRASAWAPSGGSATAEVCMAAATVARRARDAVRNDPYASRIADLWTGNPVGPGITTRWPDQLHADAWRRWAESAACDAEGRLDLYGLQALIMRAVVESGECFVRMLMTQPSPNNPIGLRLQVPESDNLDTARNGIVDGTPTIQGIALGEAGEPVGYWLHRVHPGAAWIMPGATWLGSERVPASDVLHIYRKRRPGQLRDVSWLAPVLLRLRDLGDYEAALLMKAKIEACLAAVVTEDGDQALTGAAAGAAPRLEDALRQQHGKRIAHRGAADAEAYGEVGGAAERRAGSQAASERFVTHPGDDPARKGAGPRCRLACHVASKSPGNLCHGSAVHVSPGEARQASMLQKTT
jgi:lambda family phage portal protein